MDRQKQIEDLLHARIKVEATDDQFPICEPAAGGIAELPEEEEQHKQESNIQVITVTKEEVSSEQKGWRSSLDQEGPPELPNIKEEQEEVWTCSKGEQLQGLEETDIIKFTFTPVTVKNEQDDEEKPQCSQLHWNEEMKIEADGEDCEGTEPDKNLSTESHLKPFTDDEMSHSSEPETDCGFNWDETGEFMSGLNPVGSNDDSEFDTSSESAPGFDQEKHLQKRNGNQTGGKPFSCFICGKSYTWKTTLTAHMRLHSEGKSISCPFCEKTFQFRTKLEIHMRVHTGEKPFSCSVCGTRFARKEHMGNHMRIHSNEKPFSCSVCNSTFKWKDSLRDHMRIHSDEKPFSCNVCDARFTRKDHLKNHMRIHSSEKPFSCSVCNSTFKWKDSLRDHMKIHSDDKTFNCSVCSSKFTRKDHLRNHMRIHSGEKPFSCSVCGTSFTQQGALRYHMRIHTGEKPFSCTVCSKKFGQNGSLKRHMKTHTSASESSESK